MLVSEGISEGCTGREDEISTGLMKHIGGSCHFYDPYLVRFSCAKRCCKLRLKFVSYTYTGFSYFAADSVATYHQYRLSSGTRYKSQYSLENMQSCI